MGINLTLDLNESNLNSTNTSDLRATFGIVDVDFDLDGSFH